MFSVLRKYNFFPRKKFATLALAFAFLATGAVGKAAEVLQVQSVADAREGATLTMSRYTVPADGLLVVRIGAKGPISNSVTFNGQDMTRISSVEISYSTSISVEMYFLPVAGGESGSIEVDYGFGGTDGKAIIAATLIGVDTLDHVETLTDGEIYTEGRTGPNLAECSVSTSEETIILSVLTDYGRGIPAETGLGHVLDDHPTIPESEFHETKVLAGHLMAAISKDYSLGYQNSDPIGYMDYAMIVATFTSSAQPPATVPSGGPVSRLLMSLGLLVVPLLSLKDRSRNHLAVVTKS